MTRWSGYETERRPGLSTKRSSQAPAVEVFSTRPQCRCPSRHSSLGSRNLRMSARKTFLLVEDDSFDVEFVENDRIRALGVYWSAHVATPESISP